MKLNPEQFKNAFQKLCLCFNRRPDVDTCAQYWTTLTQKGDLPFLKEAMKKACLADRFPFVSQIIQYNKDFCVEPPPFNPDTERKNVMSDSIFGLDLVMYGGCDPTEVWRLIDTNQLKLPKGYAKLRTQNGRTASQTLKKYYQDIVDKLPKKTQKEMCNGFK